MKILHLSFHEGCKKDIEYVCHILGFDLEFMFFTDGETKGNEIYNITKERAQKAWDKYKDYYNTFDAIITSDTAPISRVFLQNDWNKKLIIWVCNRFDYSNQPTKSGFPDAKYYSLMNNAKYKSNVEIVAYTAVEEFYARRIRNMSICNKIIKPIGKSIYKEYTPTIVDNKSNKLFIGSYHNDNIMVNLEQIVKSLDIPCYKGRYNGPLDLAEFKAVVHIPYAWSNFALFEGFNHGIVYFIPSLSFLMELFDENSNFFFCDYYLIQKYNVYNLCEWYNIQYKNIFVYFNSWEDLKNKYYNVDINIYKKKLKVLSSNHEKEYIERWKKILTKV